MSDGRLQPGDVLDGRYEIEGQLGEGGFSVVFRARQLTTGQTVAIKVLRADRLEGQSRREAHIARFRREMEMIARLNHPHIVRLLDSGQLAQEGLYTVLEFVNGQSLADVLALEGRLKAQEARRLMGQVLEALTCAHRAGVVHRDLKPENIMVIASGPRRSALVLDFGISGIIREVWDADVKSITQTGEFYGTPAYMAPEQLMGERPTLQTDLYAWGLVFVECLTGAKVIEGASVAMMMSQHLSPQPIALPPALAAHPLGRVLTSALDKDYKKRVAGAALLLEALDAVALDDLDQQLQGALTLQAHADASQGATWGSGDLFGAASSPKSLGSSAGSAVSPTAPPRASARTAGKPLSPSAPTVTLRSTRRCASATSADTRWSPPRPTPPSTSTRPRRPRRRPLRRRGPPRAARSAPRTAR